MQRKMFDLNQFPIYSILRIPASQVKHITAPQWWKARAYHSCLFSHDPFLLYHWGPLGDCSAIVAPGAAYWVWHGTEANEKLQFLSAFSSPWEMGCNSFHLGFGAVQTGPGRESRPGGYERFPVRFPTCCPWTRMVPILRQCQETPSVPTQMFDFCLFMTPKLWISACA